MLLISRLFLQKITGTQIAYRFQKSLITTMGIEQEGGVNETASEDRTRQSAIVGGNRYLAYIDRRICR